MKTHFWKTHMEHQNVWNEKQKYWQHHFDEGFQEDFNHYYVDSNKGEFLEGH